MADMLTHAIAMGIFAATTRALGLLRAHYAPEPAYDYPRWAYRLALAIRAHLDPRRRHHTANRRNGTILTRPRQDPT